MKSIRYHRAAAILTAAALSLSALPAFHAVAEDTLENHTFATAAEISAGTAVSDSVGEITLGTDNFLSVDYYKFQVTEDSLWNLTLAAGNSGDRLEIQLFNEDGESLGIFRNSTPILNTPESGWGKGIYYCAISNTSAFAAADYSLTLNLTPYTQLEEVPATELEDNNTADTATPLPLGQAYTGRLYNESDIDYYRLTVSEAGAVTLGMTFEKGNNYESWDLTLLDEAQNAIQTWTIPSSEDGFTAQTIGLRTGTYFCRLTRGSTIDYSGNVYQLRADFQASGDPVYEAEPNNTLETPNEIALNTSCTGLLHSSGDADCYQFTLEEASAFSLHFTHEADDADKRWDITLYDTEKNQITTWKVTGTTFETPVFGYAAGTYYCAVSENDIGMYHSDKPYILTVQAERQSNWSAPTAYEIESNGSFDTASPIAVGTACTALLENTDDADYYCTDLTNTYSKLTMHFQHDIPDNLTNTTQKPWRVSLYRCDKETGSAESTPVQTVSILIGDASTDTAALLVPAGIYYVKVDRPLLDYCGLNYRLTLEAEAVPYLKGDVNEDGTVDINDAFLALSAYSAISAGKEMPLKDAAFLAADTDEDGEVTLDDAFRILSYYSLSAAGREADWEKV